MNGWPAGWRVRRHDLLGSTQDEAISAAQRGEAGKLAILAARQSAGRGRDGRSWQSAEGNLHLSVLLRPGMQERPGACWAELAGVALFDAVGRTVSFGLAPLGAQGSLALKSPNDLLLRGAKVAGVLVDTALSPEGALDWVVIGAGVNLAHAPVLPERKTACLGTSVEPDTLAARFAAELEGWRQAGWACIHAAWVARAGVAVSA